MLVRQPRLLPHEWLLAALYAAAVALLAARGAWAGAARWAALAGGHAAVVLACATRPTPTRWRLRLGYGLLLVNVGYAWSGPAARALAVANGDALLAAADHTLFGGVLALRVARVVPAWAAEPLALCYLLLFPYVGASAVRQLARLRAQPAEAQRFFAGLLAVYAAGFAGYALLGARGPWFAAGAPFAGAHAGTFARANEWLELHATNGADAFPSVHVAASAFVLGFDRVHAPRRFALAALPVAGLWLSTLYFGFHYGVDVAAGALLAVVALRLAARTRPLAVVDRVDDAHARLHVAIRSAA